MQYSFIIKISYIVWQYNFYQIMKFCKREEHVNYIYGDDDDVKKMKMMKFDIVSHKIFDGVECIFYSIIWLLISL